MSEENSIKVFKCRFCWTTPSSVQEIEKAGFLVECDRCRDVGRIVKTELFTSAEIAARVWNENRAGKGGYAENS